LRHRNKPIENREYARWSDRVLEGSDMYEQHQKFRDFAARLNIALLERQAAAYPRPLLHIENKNDCHETVAVIAERFRASINASSQPVT